MKRIFRRAASFVICALMLFAASFTVSAAGNALESNVFLIGGVKITGISEDIELPSGGGTTLLVEVANSGTTTLTYFWEVSSDGGKTFTAAPGTNDQSSYKITNAQQNPNDPLLPYVYRVTVSGSVGDSSAVTTASETVRVLVRDADDYEYTTRVDPDTGLKVTAFIRKRAFLSVIEVPTESVSSQLRKMVRDGFAPLSAYKVALITSDGTGLPAYVGELKIDLPLGDGYDYTGQLLNVYHEPSAGSINTLSGSASKRYVRVVANSTGTFLVEVDSSTVCSIIVTVGSNGSVSPCGTVYVSKGGSKTFTITPNSGYIIDKVRLDGYAVSVTGNSFTITDVVSNHTLSVTFKRPVVLYSGIIVARCIVNITSTGDGRTSPQGSTTVDCGSSFTVYFYPDEGYQLEKILANGVEVSPGSNSYTFTVVMTTKIDVYFCKKTVKADPAPIVTRTVKAVSGKGGGISPAGLTTLNDGGDLYVYFLPDEGYEVDTVTVDGVKVDATVNGNGGSSWHFINVRDDHIINVDYKIINAVKTGETQKPAEQPQTQLPEETKEASGLEDTPIVSEDPGSTASGTTVSTARTTVQGRTAATVPSETEAAETTPEKVEPGEVVEATANVQSSVPVGLSAAPYHSVTITIDGVGGSVSPSNDLTVEAGGNQTLYFYPEDGYKVDSVLVNGTAVDGSSGSYTIENISEDVVVSVSFKKLEIVTVVEQKTDCGCVMCGLWRNIWPDLECVCPWCWIIPLLIVAVVAVVIVIAVKHSSRGGRRRG